GYRVVALILLVSVSVLAMLFDILPVLTAAILSAIIWNFIFIPPIFTFHIGNPEDSLMFLLYFIIALVNAVLTVKIRKEENKVRNQEEKEKAIKLYNTLLNSLSHELRTPIATIVGVVDTLKEQKDKLTLKQETELLLQLDKASLRLNRQVENLLNMSRIESGMIKPKLDWCDTNELINSTIQKLYHGYQQTIVFEPQEDYPLFKYDRGLIEQVLQNLLYNAINYTPDTAIITISTSYLSDKFKITIADNGNGIPDEELNNIFDKFYRLPNTKAGGSGLGLSIVKGFIDAHHGMVYAENGENGGARFTIEIPSEVSYINKLKNE
ncbi:ATP-binding protein, partial [Pelobium sp.]